MNDNAVTVVTTCVGLLVVILSKPLGESGYRRSLDLGNRDYGVWWYRGPILIVGVLLVLMSFIYE
ncbi:MAG TPA: hypothetical protein VF736_20605 [Pyrinomonadaceae bacterium]